MKGEKIKWYKEIYNSLYNKVSCIYGDSILNNLYMHANGCTRTT